MSDEVHLFIDDTGSRHPDRVPVVSRNDGLDCFGFGGVMINQEDIETVWDAHRAFCDKWGITYPLHSYLIRGGRGSFSWLKNPERAVEFLPALSEFLTALPALGIAAVIHRPGYVARYHNQYQGQPWLMDKTALLIVVERAAKYARIKGRRLRIYFEQCGKQEDRALIDYIKTLKTDGLPFAGDTSRKYDGLSAEDFKALILGAPIRKTKSTPMMQIADLYLYPMAKAGYDPTYRPYVELMASKNIIDAQLTDEDRPKLGVKYSCFDFK